MGQRQRRATWLSVLPAACNAMERWSASPDMATPQATVGNEVFRALEPVRRLPATLAAALPVTDVTALQRVPAGPQPAGYALPAGPSPQAWHTASLRQHVTMAAQILVDTDCRSRQLAELVYRLRTVLTSAGHCFWTQPERHEHTSAT